MVECQLPKLDVAGSSPVSRSNAYPKTSLTALRLAFALVVKQVRYFCGLRLNSAIDGVEAMKNHATPREQRLCIVLVGLLLAGSYALAQTKVKPDTSKIPKKVMEALKGKFPKAEVQQWTQEKEGGTVVHDIEFTQEGWKFEADIKEDGTIHNWERQITPSELPATVRKAVENKYPKAAVQEVMFITAVKDGKDTTEGYEIVLKTAGGKTVEVTVAPDGKVLEDSGERK